MRLDEAVIPAALETTAAWSVVFPVKVLAAAKSRLASGTPAPGELALAFFLDAIAAAVATPRVARVVVATGDERVRTHAESVGCARHRRCRARRHQRRRSVGRRALRRCRRHRRPRLRPALPDAGFAGGRARGRRAAPDVVRRGPRRHGHHDVVRHRRRTPSIPASARLRALPIWRPARSISSPSTRSLRSSLEPGPLRRRHRSRPPARTRPRGGTRDRSCPGIAGLLSPRGGPRRDEAPHPQVGGLERRGSGGATTSWQRPSWRGPSWPGPPSSREQPS